MLKCLLNPVQRKPLRIPVTFPRGFSTSKCIFANYYDVLKSNPKATQKEIKEAYFKLSKQSHPDLNQNDPNCHDRFVKLQEAYRVLGNPITRREYDMNTGRNRQESYYHRDARYKPDFSAKREEWIRQQNERMERNPLYNKTYYMTPEELRIFSKRKKIWGNFNRTGNIIVATVLFFLITIFLSECLLWLQSEKTTSPEEDIRKQAQLLRENEDGHYFGRTSRTRSKLMKDLEKSEARADHEEK